MGKQSTVRRAVHDVVPAPVAPGSPEYARLIAAVREKAAAERAAGSALHGTIGLIRGARLGALRLPRSEGGAGASLRQLHQVLMDLAEADPDVPHILRAHFWFVEERLRSPNATERTRWLGRIAAGDLFGNATSELGGSAAVGTWNFETKLLREDDGYVLRGRKFYCTGSLYCDWVSVLASDADDQLVAAVLPIDREGFVLEDDWDGIGQKLTASGTATFTDVIVKQEEVLETAVRNDASNQDDKPTDPYLIGQVLQLILTAIIAGILRSVVTDATRFVRARARTYSHGAAETAADDPLLQQVVGQIASAAFAAEAAILAAADAQDAALATWSNGKADFDLTHRGSLVTAQAKVIVDELAQRAAAQLFDVGGSSAVRTSANLDRHWRNIRTIASHNPTLYKARSIGAFLLNGEYLPTNSLF